MESYAVVEEHRVAGREFEATGVQSFVREEGDGQPVICLHPRRCRSECGR